MCLSPLQGTAFSVSLSIAQAMVRVYELYSLTILLAHVLAGCRFLDKNQLTSLPESISNLTRLVSLSVMHATECCCGCVAMEKGVLPYCIMRLFCVTEWLSLLDERIMMLISCLGCL